ncbi:MAG: MgtC/SapB family protein [Candidatus Margulisbacteria bacterium]|nr:MgtC/SapB family protein [Candidatus Margulisiibacteriota bacterium]
MLHKVGMSVIFFVCLCMRWYNRFMLLSFSDQMGFLSVCLGALFCGGLLGMEREYRQKPVGFRSILLICFVATVLTYFAFHLSSKSDPGHVVSQVILCVGLLGGAVMVYARQFLKGLKYAVGIWVAGSVGVLLGGMFWQAAILLTVVSLCCSLVSWVFCKSASIQNLYSLSIDARTMSALAVVEDMIEKFGLIVEQKRMMKQDSLHLDVTYTATSLTHHLFIKRLLHTRGVGDVRII